MENPTEYYKKHGPMTTAGPFRSELQTFPHEVAELCELIQGNLIHRELAALEDQLRVRKLVFNAMRQVQEPITS